MKKLLYIIANSKPEELSSSRIVAKEFIKKFLESHNDFEVEEVNLYEDKIPRLEYVFFQNRNTLINEDALNNLDEKHKDDAKRIIELCDQFRNADMYVVAAPMWSLSFPAPLKEYIDCVIQNDKTIKVLEDKVEGLLKDKHREFIYVQSSGGKVPWLIRPILNKGLNYVEDIMKYIGIKSFHEILVDGTGTSKEEQLDAITRGIKKINDIILDIRF